MDYSKPASANMTPFGAVIKLPGWYSVNNILYRALDTAGFSRIRDNDWCANVELEQAQRLANGINAGMYDGKTVLKNKAA